MDKNSIKEIVKLQKQATTEHLLQREAWGLLALCNSSLALIGDQSTEAPIKQYALECLLNLRELALALDTPQAKEFAEENALYFSKIKNLN